MRTCSAIAAIVSIAAPHAWAANPCETQANTIEINQCAKQQFEEQDRLLNAAYKALVTLVPAENEPGISGESPRAMLIKAQRRWIEFREADCKAKYQLYAGGTIRNAIYLGCMQERTEQRIKELASSEWQGG
jgi:uncharacterized protein YecT (DUF1311 family)